MEQNRLQHEEKWKQLPTQYIGLRLTTSEAELLTRTLESAADLPKSLDNVVFKLKEAIELDGWNANK